MRMIRYGAVLVFGWLVYGCMQDSALNAPRGGTVQLAVLLERSGGQRLAKQGQTDWDSLIVAVHGDDMQSRFCRFKLSPTQNFLTRELVDIPSGAQRWVVAWTIDKEGEIIHAPDSQQLTIQSGRSHSVQLELLARLGSIYIVLDSIDATIATVCASFAVDTLLYSICLPRERELFISLDKIPYELPGILSISGTDSGGNLVTQWQQPSFMLSRSNTTLTASFVTVGSAQLNLSVQQPAVTLIRGRMSPTDSLTQEWASVDTSLIISEIMFTGGSSTGSRDYLELYNSGAKPLVLDTLYIDVSGLGAPRLLSNVSIAAGDFFVVGDKYMSASAVQQWEIDTVVGLDLGSTDGCIFIRDKRGRVLDWVAFHNKTDSQGWPYLSSSAKTAVVLDSLKVTNTFNNVGHQWQSAQSQLYLGDTLFYGTPGRGGR